MEFILGILIGILIGIIIIACISVSVIDGYSEQSFQLIKEQLDLTQENEELKKDKNNAESRATQYARKLKQIEDIVLQKGRGTIVDRIDKIKEVITDRQINK